MTIQESTHCLQKKDWATECILVLENQTKMYNLKFHGFPEKVEAAIEIRVFMDRHSWIATEQG